MPTPDLLNAPEFTTLCNLRWSDFDRLGHLNQAVYHVLVEQARVAWLTHVRVDDDWDEHAFVLARVELDYRHEVDTSHASVVATCRLLRIGNSSLTVEQQVRLQDGTVCAAGQAVMVGWNARARGKRVFDDAERAGFLG